MTEHKSSERPPPPPPALQPPPPTELEKLRLAAGDFEGINDIDLEDQMAQFSMLQPRAFPSALDPYFLQVPFFLASFSTYALYFFQFLFLLFLSN